MIKKIRGIWNGKMLRPLIYMAFTRFVLSLCLFLLIDRFGSGAAGRRLLPMLFALGGAVFAALAWIAWLRLDGVRLPKLMMLRINPRKKPERSYGDMIDYVDEPPPVTFEELDDDGKDVCILGADLFCCAVFLVLSLFV